MNRRHTMYEPETCRLSGSVERVTFHSPDSGFAVLKVKVRGFRENVTIVGNLPCVNVGEWVEAAGIWVMNSVHGRQLKAELLKTSRPDSPEGMEKYLSSGLVKGIGPKYAEKLVEAFGADVFEVIEHTPGKILEIDGIGRKRQQAIIDAWSAEKSVREIMVFLYNHGVGTSQAFRIHKQYGVEAISRVKNDPYSLVAEVWGIGFKTADKIAASIGIPHDSHLRARAGLHYIPGDTYQRRPLWRRQKSTIERTSEILDIDTDTIGSALDTELKRGTIAVEFRGTGLQMIQGKPSSIRDGFITPNNILQSISKNCFQTNVLCVAGWMWKKKLSGSRKKQG